MNTDLQQTLKPAVESYLVTGDRGACPSESRPVGAVATGIGEILAMRVGCWRAPVNPGVDLPIAS